MTNTHPASTTLGQIRRRITSGLLVLGLTVGTLAVTAAPAEAAGAVFTCYTVQYPNFTAAGRIVRLQTKLSNGAVIIIDQKVLDAGGCAFFLVPPMYQGNAVRTVISYQDTGSYYGAIYDGWSYGAFEWQPTRNSWFNWGSSTYGHALSGDGVWWLVGTVRCIGCQM